MIEITSPTAFEYVRAQLDLGKTLCKYLKLQEIEKGRVFAFVEGEFDKERLHKFESGGLYLPEKTTDINKTNVAPIINKTRYSIPDYIKKYISENENNCCVMEEPNAKPSDFFATDRRLEYVNLDDEMYYFW